MFWIAVNEPIAVPQRPIDGVLRLLVAQTEGADPKDGHFDSVVQRDHTALQVKVLGSRFAVAGGRRCGGVVRRFPLAGGRCLDGYGWCIPRVPSAAASKQQTKRRQQKNRFFIRSSLLFYQ